MRSFIIVSTLVFVSIGSTETFGQELAARSAVVKSTAKRWGNRKLVKIRTRPGDTLELLGDRFGISSEEISNLNGIAANSSLAPGREILIPLPSSESLLKASSAKLTQHNGNPSSIDNDDVWENIQGVWFRKGSAARSVQPLETGSEASRSGEEVQNSGLTRIAEATEAQRSTVAQPVWIFLVGGARVEADSVNETAEGAWYTRGNLTIFIERSRIERIERERVTGSSESSGSWTERGWSTGNAKIDSLIKENGTRFGVDPYLIFCVMEQESRFKPWVVSPKGARGLMQLMPGTGARFGVRRPFDPAENIMGGTRYLKQLLENFDGRVDLVLAGYNAGEGAVRKFGRNVPPYRETQNYVRLIGKRYGQPTSGVTSTLGKGDQP
jgi:LysM repeat protein